MKQVNVTIEGISALLMHKFPMEPIEAIEKKPKEEQAELSAYRIPNEENLYIPGEALQRALINGATYSKGKGRSSLAKVTSAAMFISPEYLDLGTKDFGIDARSVVIRATGGRIVRYRPRLDKWAVSFILDYDETLMTEQQVRKIVDDTGQRVGLLDFRPEKKGPFGRFMVTLWEGRNGKSK